MDCYIVIRKWEREWYNTSSSEQWGDKGESDSDYPSRESAVRRGERQRVRDKRGKRTGKSERRSRGRQSWQGQQQREWEKVSLGEEGSKALFH